jgi:hypothetical protein
MKVLILLLAFILSCSSVSYHRNNVSNVQVSELSKGQDLKLVTSRLGQPIHFEIYKDGSFLHIYTNDWDNGTQIYCRNLAIAYDSSGKLIKYWYTKEYFNPQLRCDKYTIQSAQNAAAWTSIANSTTQAIREESASGTLGKSCYDDGQCGTSEVCAKKKTFAGTLEFHGVCTTVLYHE